VLDYEAIRMTCITLKGLEPRFKSLTNKQEDIDEVASVSIKAASMLLKHYPHLCDWCDDQRARFIDTNNNTYCWNHIVLGKDIGETNCEICEIYMSYDVNPRCYDCWLRVCTRCAPRACPRCRKVLKRSILDTCEPIVYRLLMCLTLVGLGAFVYYV